jgi:hypothetical protein
MNNAPRIYRTHRQHCNRMEKYLRLPLSVDCAERTRGQIRSLQETHDVFRNIWENTGHDDGKRRSFPVKK